MEKIRRVFTDFIFGMIGLVVMNAVLSLVVQPYFKNALGLETQGKILFFMALMNWIAGSFGSGANYGRMKVFSAERKTVNGEYNIFLLISLIPIILITVAAVLLKQDSAGVSVVLIIVLIFATVVRTYADVEYRLNLNYKRFALYYTAIALGYGLGLLLFQLYPNWVIVLLTGEIAGLLFVTLTGNVFRGRFLQKTEHFPEHMKTCSVLTGSYLLSDFVASADRLLFPVLLTNGDEMTALYYYASFVGKTMSLLSTPLNGVLSGHLSKEKGGITRKTFIGIIGLMLLIFAVVTGVSVGGSHLFVYLFYRENYPDVRELFLLANAGQVIFFICNSLMVIVVRYTKERIQVIVNVIYIALFFAVTVPLILKLGISGMAWGLFIVNMCKFILYAVLGFFGIAKEKH